MSAPRPDARETPFFIGYSAVPQGLRLTLLAVAALLIGGFAALALAIGAAQDDPGDAAFHWGWGAQRVTGVLQAKPYPVVHVTRGSDRIPAGRSVMLAGEGKRGVKARAEELDGRLVEVNGIVIRRGSMDALQVFGGDNNFKTAEGDAAPVATVSKGRWRLAGEICDGKCYVGAMLPGRGISHRGCANLCLLGGLPPVFVTAQPVDGTTSFLLADADGGPLPDIYLDYVALYVTLDGEVERRGSIAVLKVDMTTLKVL